MAQRYEIKAKGQSGRKYRIELHDSTYTGTTVTTLDADNQFVRFVGGSEEFVGDEPIWGKEARFNVITSEDLTPLYGLQDRDVEARVYDADTSTLVFKGYILTDFYTDNPYSNKPGIELRASDGLKTLEADSFSRFGYGSEQTPKTVLVDILSELYVNPLDVEIGTEWFMNGGMTSSDNPLANCTFNPNNYRDERPEGSYFNNLDVLKDICETFNLTVKQARVNGELVWTLYQRTQKTNGSVKSWRYNPDNTEAGTQPQTRDITKTIDADIEFEPTREFERRVQSVSITHNHTELGQLLLESGFEGTLNEWNLYDKSGYDTLLKNHDNIGGVTPGATSTNSQALVVNQTGNPSSTSVDSVAIQGGIEGFNSLPFGSYGSLSFKHTVKNVFAGRMLLNVGSHYLTEFSTKIRSDTLKGKGTLPVNSIDRPIPEGTRVPISTSSSNPLPPVKASMELTERAETGDDELVGDLNGDVNEGDYAFYAGFKDTSSADLYIPAWFETGARSEGWKKRDIFFSLVDGNGNQVNGEAELHLRFVHGSRNVSSFPKLFWDDISLGLFAPNGSAINGTTRTATVPEFGQGKSLKVRTASGPTTENIASLESSNYDAANWGIGSGGGNLSLTGLAARERLRHSRNHLERLNLTAFARDTGLEIDGHEVVQLDGTDYTVSSVETRPDDGRVRLTLLELVDEGTTNLQVNVTRSTDSTSSVSSGSATGSGSVATTWNDLGGELAGNIPFNESGPTERGAEFTNVDPNIKWVRDPANSRALEVVDTSSSTDLLWLDEQGNLRAAGEVEAFADGSGTSTTTNSELQLLDDGTSLTMDAKSINFKGGTVTQSGDDVTVEIDSGTDFQAGDNLSFDTSTSPKTLDVTGSFYSDSDAVSAVNAEASLSVDITGDADTLDGVQLADITFSDISATRYTDSEARSAVSSSSITGSITLDTSGPTERGINFVGATPEIEYKRDPSNSRALEVRDTSSSTDLLWLDESGNLRVSGEVEAFADGGGSSSTTYSELQVLDDGTSLTLDAQSINFKGGTVTQSGNEIAVELGSGGGVDFQAGDNLSFDTSTSPQTLDFTGTLYTDSDAVSAVESAGTINLTNTKLKWDRDTDGALLEFIDYGDNSDYLTLTVNDDNGDAFRIRHEDPDGNIVNVADFDRDGLELPRGLTVNGNTVSPDSNSSAHHSKYTDSEAVSAVENESTVNFSGNLRVSNSAIIGISGGPEFEFEDKGIEIQGTERLSFGDQSGNVDGLDMGGKRIGNVGNMDFNGQGYITFNNDDGEYYLGGGNTPDAETTGVHLEAGSNPSSGDALFVVESSGGSERLRVEHNGTTSTSNSLDVAGTLTCGSLVLPEL